MTFLVIGKMKSFGKWNKIFLTEWENVDKYDKCLTDILNKWTYVEVQV